MNTLRRTSILMAAAVGLSGCGTYPGGYGRTQVAPTRVDPVRLGAPPTLDPGIARRAGPYIRPSGPYLGRPAYRTPPF